MFTKKYTAIKDSQFSIDTINVHYITFCYCNCRDRVYIRNIHRNVFFQTMHTTVIGDGCFTFLNLLLNDA